MGLFDFFKSNKDQSKKKEDVNKPLMADLEQNPLQVGDIVDALRYDLGRCKLVEGQSGYEYESLETGTRVSWLRMIDAATQLQKVKKVTS
ncbi:hypothetical protein QNI19_31745 [Cytophagaceae bacterium DM2B3-1]|uniref:Uncharacterized protein n=1 Tax=Xanthocytophaga flava TaxID=3048013 RepID=A0ABT7CVL1_9BACT|nr:hypothetical protein [Xanthocytophaga flavus]MDJ1469188.1 hypothetical protein [Xanthocytophaga flavus]MDJ1497556.1 hypothetical protein [Xanthocytophaga flavus]